jgi:hypothetical protein
MHIRIKTKQQKTLEKSDPLLHHLKIQREEIFEALKTAVWCWGDSSERGGRTQGRWMKRGTGSGEREYKRRSDGGGWLSRKARSGAQCPNEQRYVAYREEGEGKSEGDARGRWTATVGRTAGNERRGGAVGRAAAACANYSGN